MTKLLEEQPLALPGLLIVRDQTNFNFHTGDKLCQESFKEKTTNTKSFTQCFESDESNKIQFQRWKIKLVKAFLASFKKIRVNDNDKKKPSDIDVLLNKKKTILKKKNMDEGVEHHKWPKISATLLPSCDYDINRRLQKVSLQYSGSTSLHLLDEHI